VQIKALKTIGDSIGTIALGQLASGPAAKALDAKCKVKCEILSLPIGISATDKFVDALRKMAGVSVPESIDEERGQLIDMLTDMHQYLFNKKVALFGDPDHLLSLIEFLSDIGMKPVHIVTGTPGNKFETRTREILKDKVPNANIRVGGDVFLLHQWIKNEPIDLLIGNTYGKYIARDENIPFIRAGFPILDRVGHSYFPDRGLPRGDAAGGEDTQRLYGQAGQGLLRRKMELVM